MEQPSFNDTNSHNLRNIADTSDEVIRGLKSIDTKAESRDIGILPILTTINRGLALGFKRPFNAINYLTVPRWVILTADNIVELAGFADASSLKHIASRGIGSQAYLIARWWQGPPWLRLETSSWPKAESSCDEASDEIASQGSSISSSHINTTSLTFSETKTAEETIIRWVQGFYFQEEIRSIKKQISLPPQSPLRSLHPFIDEHGLVRGGRRRVQIPSFDSIPASYHTSF
ncbi:hypothetical protein TNCV_2463181, partial [Trichonephila clavipes]